MRTIKDFIEGFIMAAVIMLFMMAANNSNADVVCFGTDVNGNTQSGIWVKGQTTDGGMGYIARDPDFVLIQCTAYGVELPALYNKFPSLPLTNGYSTVIFTGDTARFIMLNIIRN